VLSGRRAVRTSRAAEARTEALRVLRSNLLVAVADLDHPVVVVTSANPGEGKTATCAGLAASLAAAGRKVVAVDLDLRHPELHLRLGANNEVGVVDVVADRCPLAEAIQLVEVGPDQGAGGHGFYFLAAGHSIANPTELLGVPTMGRLLGSMASQADLVLVDTAPVLPVADTLVVARMAAGALLVVEAGRTSDADVRAAGDALARNDVRVLGVALNKLDAREVRLGYGDAGATVAGLDGADRTGAPWARDWAELRRD
jgi:capsular exopolysaccharide synthesis family protein